MRTLLLICAGAFAALDAGAQETFLPAPEQRVIAYLAREVPRWSRENHCFSCHNNGDAARALYLAGKSSYSVPADALRDTTDWLLRPLQWENNKGEPGFSDKKLARIQFAAALAEAVQAGVVARRGPLMTAAEILLDDQDEDGSWAVDPSGSVGSPVTYGRALATYMVRRTLAAAGLERFRDAIEKADAWLAAIDPGSTVDAAAVVLALSDRLGTSLAFGSVQQSHIGVLEVKRQRALGWILRSQTGDGSWGPYPKTPAEVFDTAIVVLALNAAYRSGSVRSETLAAYLLQGREYLIATQLASGGWPETTRPSGSQSYAQHISTSGWAALALLQTQSVVTKGGKRF